MGGTKGWGNRAERVCTPSEWPDILMVGHLPVLPSNLTCDRGKRLLAKPLRVRLPPYHGEHSIQFLGFHQNVTRLGSLTRPHDVP